MTTAAAPTTTASARTPWRLRPATIATIAVVALFVGMRLWRITDFALDGDEIFSVQLARDNWHDLFSAAAQDAIHPPLLYILLKFWIGIGGESLWWLRLFPVIASVLCLLPVFALCRDLNISPAARNLAIAIVAVHPYAMYYSQHLRMYCLLMLAGCFRHGALNVIWAWPRFAIWSYLSTANLFLGYTQYYGWCIVLLEFVYLCGAELKNPIPFLLCDLAGGDSVCAVGLVSREECCTRAAWRRIWAGSPGPHFGELNWFWVDLTGFAEFRTCDQRGALAVCFCSCCATAAIASRACTG